MSTDFSIFIEHSYIGEEGSNQSYSNIVDLFTAWCEENPTNEFCNLEPRIIYINGTQYAEFNVSTSQRTFDALMLSLLEQAELEAIESGLRKEQGLQVVSLANETDRSLSYIKNKMDNIEKTVRENFSRIWLIIIIILLILTATMGALFVIREIKKRRRTDFQYY